MNLEFFEKPTRLMGDLRYARLDDIELRGFESQTDGADNVFAGGLQETVRRIVRRDGNKNREASASRTFNAAE